MIIATQRLDLVELDIEAHRALRDGRLSEIAGASVPGDFAHGVPSELRIEQLRRDPQELPWLVRAIVLRDEARVVGSAGFHAPPLSGLAELGYEICEGDRRRGFAREAVTGLMDWAEPQVATFRASIAPGNAASQALVVSLGFVRVGEQIDPVDGLEWVFEKPVTRSSPGNNGATGNTHTTQ
jgi:[ribosomal protein S5]-alanine N-acetyltransferase